MKETTKVIKRETIVEAYRMSRFSERKKNQFVKLQGRANKLNNIELERYRIMWFENLTIGEKIEHLKKVIEKEPYFLLCLERMYKSRALDYFGERFTALKNNFVFTELFQKYCDILGVNLNKEIEV